MRTDGEDTRKHSSNVITSVDNVDIAFDQVGTLYGLKTVDFNENYLYQHHMSLLILLAEI